MEDYVYEKLSKQGISPPKSDVKIDWTQFDLSPPDYYEELISIIKKKGGQIVNPFYPGSHGTIEILCSKGHKFKTTPTQLKHKKSWCRKCYEERRKNERDYLGRFTSYS